MIYKISALACSYSDHPNAATTDLSCSTVMMYCIFSLSFSVSCIS
ncbi:MAG: hypothetical protein NZM44_01600 [Candidatus Calescibacterium sp.]|nr:hypothetical protein [Candidatus Calescibacterium sp.]